MKTYLEDPMQDMPQMGGMYGMSQMKDMQSMYPMMGGMYEMPPMMDMQIMYHMMQCTYHMMQCTHHLMCMQGMYGMHPMMCTDEISQMKPMYMPEDKRQIPVPMLVNLVQLSPNQIEISYDRDVDMRLGMKPTNYWIQDTMNILPKGIATLGKNDKVNASNSLTGSMVRIDSKNGSAKTFILTFNKNIPRGAEYMLIICYVTVKGAPPYSGDNGMAIFIGK